MNHNNITAAIHDPDDSDDEAEYIPSYSAALLPFKADLREIDGLTGFRPTLSSAHMHGAKRHTYCDMEQVCPAVPPAGPASRRGASKRGFPAAATSSTAGSYPRRVQAMHD